MNDGWDEIIALPNTTTSHVCLQSFKRSMFLMVIWCQKIRNISKSTSLCITNYRFLWASRTTGHLFLDARRSLKKKTQQKYVQEVAPETAWGLDFHWGWIFLLLQAFRYPFRPKLLIYRLHSREVWRIRNNSWN